MKPAIEKLPLVTRKNLRDNWEAKKPEYEKQLSEAFGGEAWTITLEAPLIYANCQRKDLLDRIGDAITWYIKPLISNVTRWATEYGTEGLTELNNIVPKHTIELRPQEETGFTYGGLQVKDGVLRLVFADDNFATNCDSVSDPEAITEAIKTASTAGAEGAVKSKLNIQSRLDIRKKWDSKAEALRKNIADLVAIPDLVLEVQWEDIAAGMLSRTSKDKNDEYRLSRERTQNLSQIASITVLYFEALAKYLEREKFGQDDMLQEAFQESVSKKKVGLRMVDKLEKKSYCETVIEDGVMWMQTIPKEWRVNIDAVADTVMELF